MRVRHPIRRAHAAGPTAGWNLQCARLHATLACTPDSVLSICVLALPRFAQALALALYSGRFWPVSVALVAKAIGATTAGSFSRGSSFATALALRSAVSHDSKAPSHRQSRLPSAGEFRYSCQDLPVVSTLEQEIDAPCPRRRASMLDRPLEYRGTPVLPPPAWWGIDEQGSDGPVSDSDFGAGSSQWSSVRATAFVPQRARGTDSTFPSAAGCDRSEVVRV